MISGYRFIPAAAQPVAASGARSSVVPFGAFQDKMIFVDIADPFHPRVTEQLSIDGFQIDSRRVGNRVHSVSRFAIPAPETLVKDPAFLDLLNRYRTAVWNGTGAAEENRQVAQMKEEIARAVRREVEGGDAQRFLPQASRQVGDATTAFPLLSCSDVLLPEVKIDLGLLIVSSVDLTGSNLAATALINNAWLTYASKDHLYVAQTSGGWWWGLNQPSQTALYQFRIWEEKPVYSATGSIDGWVGNRFSLSEWNGFLRVASTERRVNSETNQPEQKNHLFILEENGAGELQVAGAVKGFAPDEQITGARFLGARAFIVTAKQVDPLFAFDLSDPRRPRLMGELSFPGITTYLHKLDENHLLTIGFEAGKVQIQLFDVTDLARPILLHKFLPAGGGQFSWTTAGFDPHAFTFDAPSGLLAIPFITSDFSTGDYFSGIAAFRVSVAGGITELGRVDHADLAAQAYCTNIPADQAWIAEACKGGMFLPGAMPTRSVIMTSGADRFLYSLSSIGVKATPIDRPATVLGSLLLPNPGLGWWFGIAAADKASL